MAYSLDISDNALNDAREALDWMEQRSPDYASEWYASLMDAVFSLEEMPRRCSFAPENSIYFREVRHLLYVKRRVTYRIIFVIMQEETEQDDGVVRVFRIRHGAQQTLTAGQMAGGEQD